ncbi:MAG TPA: MotE family protein [Rhizobiaceae bacterium]|nr:MotE family protein [Rhizobiaceae bacterium]
MMARSPLPSHPRFKALTLAGALGALLAVAGPAATETAAPAEPIVVDPAKQSEIQRFCSNIADAARDRRYALQAAELKELQAEIDKRMALLEEKRAEYEGWLKRREEFLDKAEDNIVQIYSRMKPDAAAERLEVLRAELAAGILMKLDSRKAGTILNEMDSKAAATLTTIMVSATRKEDPS